MIGKLPIMFSVLMRWIPSILAFWSHIVEFSKILPFNRSKLSLTSAISAMTSLAATPLWVLECHMKCHLFYRHYLRWLANSSPHATFSPTRTKCARNKPQCLHIVSRVSITQAPISICSNEKSSQQQFLLLPFPPYCSCLEMGYKTLPPHHYRSL